MPPLAGLAFSDAALAYLGSGIPLKHRKQIVKKAKTLLDNPHPPKSKPVHNVMDGDSRVYRVRSGDYRILYSIRKDEVVILDIDHRKDVYRGLT